MKLSIKETFLYPSYVLPVSVNTFVSRVYDAHLPPPSPLPASLVDTQTAAQILVRVRCGICY